MPQNHTRFAQWFTSYVPMMGGDETPAERRERLEGEVRTAFTAMEEAHTALQGAGEDADMDALEATFTTAETAHTTARSTLEQANEREERAQRIADARQNLPVAPVTDRPAHTRVEQEPLVYQRRGGEGSFFVDQLLAQRGNPVAQERLAKHGAQMRDLAVHVPDASAEVRALNETAGTGGEFVPPLWMQSEWIKLQRAGRPFANAIRSLPLPPNTNSINIPAVATGTAVAAQSDGLAVQSTDLTTTSLNVPVKTVAGQQDLAQQLVDRSLPGIDTIVFDDLSRDYGTKIDVQTLSGSGSGANALGILNVAGVPLVTFTSGAPTVAGLYSKIADAIQRIHTTRFLPPTLIVMHPRRWAWILAASDGQGRPLVVPAGPAFNQPAMLERVASENVVGSMLGLPVLIDASLPTTLGNGTNEDRIIVCRAEDIYLFEEDVPRSRLLQEVLSGTLQVRAQVYGYFAFTAARYPSAIAQIGGSGLAVPVF